MDELYYSVSLDFDRMLCLSPITDRRLAMAGQEIEDTSGYFLYEQRGSGDFANIEILAHVVSMEGVQRIRDMLNMS